jgi:hypothetical protein
VVFIGDFHLALADFHIQILLYVVFIYDPRCLLMYKFIIA